MVQLLNYFHSSNNRLFRVCFGSTVLFEGDWVNFKRFNLTCKLAGLIQLHSDASAAL